MKLLNKMIKVSIGVCFAVCLLISNVYAASLSMNASSKQVKVGETFTVKLSASEMYVKFNSFSVSGPGEIVSGKPSDIDTGGSVSLSIKATGTGNITVSMSGTAARYDTTTTADEPISRSVSIKVVNPSSSSPSSPSTSPNTPTTEDTRSKENTLSSLTVSEGTLSPEFSANTTKYVVNIAGDKTKLTISAKAKDAKAKVSGAGEKELTVGKNTFKIVCTAENGSTRDYTVEVNVDEKPLVYVEFDGQKLGVVRNLTDVGSPNGFEKGKTQLNGQEIDAWVNEKLHMTLCYLINEKGEKSFYVVEDEKIVYQFQRIQIDERNFFVIPVEDKMKNRDGFEFTKIQINDLEFDGWKYKDDAMKSYVQIYLMNELGEKHIYNYETSENQLQIYTETKTKAEGINIFMISTIAFAATTGVLLFMYINFKKKSISAIKKYYDQKQ